MAQGGRKGTRAHFASALNELSIVPKVDPKAGDVGGWGYDSGSWPGYPADKMPPDCPVRPLGHRAGVYFFFDASGQINIVKRSDFGKKVLLDLFNLRPRYLEHHWPRWGKGDSGKATVNGVDTDHATACLMKACGDQGVISLEDTMRGRGMWATDTGQLVWHAGNALYQIKGRKLEVSEPGMVEDMVYPRMPNVLTPWAEVVDPADSPVHAILATLKTWNWERPALDPVLIIGWLGCAFLGAALPWRPTLFIAGDKRVGKSTLQGLIRGLFGRGLIKAANTTAAGIYQRVGPDALPVSIDELEAKADDKRAPAIIELARLSASGDEMLRGGADHNGVSFTLRNAFAFSAINAPAMEPADRQRMLFLNLQRLLETRAPGELTLGEHDGRMILRAVMDAWPRFEPTWKVWRNALKDAGFEDRGTYGVALTVAQLLLGDEAMEAAGLPIGDEKNAVGHMVAAATAQERQAEGENWIDCVSHVLGHMLENWKAGERSTIGRAIEDWESDGHNDAILRAQLAGAGLGFKAIDAAGQKRLQLAVPVGRSPLLDQVFRGSKWAGGVWSGALKQAPHDVVLRDGGNAQNVKINRQAMRCLLVDMQRFDEVTGEGV